MKTIRRCISCAFALILILAAGTPPLRAQETRATKSAEAKRKVIIDQDCAGPGGTDMQAVLALVQSPDTDVLGITVVTGDAWLAEEVQHTLRLMEIIGRTDIPVVPGAAFPLVNTKEYIARWETLHGKVVYQGAWNYARGGNVHGPWEIPPLPEGAPATKPSNEDAAHFLIRMVHQYPHEVTIYEGGPLTNLALAQAIDPEFASLAKELIVMAGSILPQTDDPEFTMTPRREFNLWIDPEASQPGAACAVGARGRYHRGYFGEDTDDQGFDRAGRQGRGARGAVHREICRAGVSVGRAGGCGVAGSFDHYEDPQNLHGRFD